MFSKKVSLGLLLAGFCASNLMASPSKPAGEEIKIADLEVEVSDKLSGQKTHGLRTLYIIVYDSQSSMPMPYGALKIDLSKDPQGTVYKGSLNSNNINVMSGGPLPETLRIKARLDRDGSAGKDSPGDVVGTIEGVKKGSSVKIKIDKEIN
jgi:hypothetical protein